MTKSEFQLPDIAALEDQELDCLRLPRDGRWSAQTKYLMGQFQTVLLDLNQNWANCEPAWQCPCCSRQKADIARLSSHGALQCRIESHHDHLADYIKRVFYEKTQGAAADVQLENARKAITELTSRFSPSLVCVDCNAAEGSAKRSLYDVVPKHFSFAVAEIKRFISVAPNRAHVVSLREAATIWEEVKTDFDERVAQAVTLTLRAARGNGLRTQSVGVTRATEDRGWVIVSVLNDGLMTAVMRIGSELDARSISTDSVGSRSLTAHEPADTLSDVPRIPTEADLKAHFDAMTQGKPEWIEAGDAWHCPCCNRSKVQIVRQSKRGAWTGRLHRTTEWIEETDPVSLRFRSRSASGRVYAGYSTIMICQDCRLVTTKLRQVTPDLVVDLSIDQVRSMLETVSPHRDHVVRFSDSMVAALEVDGDLQSTIRNFHEHRDLAISVSDDMRALLRCGSSNLTALSTLTSRLMSDTGMSWEEAEPLVEWLVNEGDRLRSKWAESDRIGGNS